MVSHPELGSDLPIGLDWELRCDKTVLKTVSAAENCFSGG